jgi:hypothetical protein
MEWRYRATTSLTTDAKGHPAGTLTIPATIQSVATGNGAWACAEADWTSISLVIGARMITLPDISRAYNSDGSSTCVIEYVPD